MAGENLPVAVEPAIPLESADVPEPDGLSLQSPNLAQQNALATFEAQQEAERRKKIEDATKVMEGREKEVFDMAERAKAIVETAERRRSAEQQRRRQEDEQRRADQLKQQEATMRRFEEKKQEGERRLREQREEELRKREAVAFARQETAKTKLLEDDRQRKAEEEARLEKEALLQKRQLEKQAAAMAKFEEQQRLKKMTEEERKAYLAEKALKEAVEQAVNDLTRAVEDKATIKEKPVESPEETGPETPTTPGKDSVPDADKCWMEKKCCVVM